MPVVILALGSNLGNKKKNIIDAISHLQMKLVIKKVAPTYETIPVGFAEQDNFYNTTLQAVTELNPKELLRFVKDIEKKLGRKKRFVNGPREIDIDIIFYDQEVVKEEGLVIPHPRTHLRDFVLVPLSDIAPEFPHPILKKTVNEILSEIPKKERVVLSRVD